MSLIRLLLLLLPLLAACGVPHPMDRLDRTGRASAGGHDFRVNWNAGRAQATRMNRAFLPDRAAVAMAAVDAVTDVSGCAVRRGSVRGDVALVKMRLKCPP